LLSGLTEHFGIGEEGVGQMVSFYFLLRQLILFHCLPITIFSIHFVVPASPRPSFPFPVAERPFDVVFFFFGWKWGKEVFGAVKDPPK
jgi:hypothetical protein